MMTPIYFTVSIIFAFVTFIGYGQTQQFEGNSCRMHDGSRGVCKIIEQCQSITDAIAQSASAFNNIVICSFLGTTQIVCCADEKPKNNRRPHTPPPNTNTDIVFETDGFPSGGRQTVKLQPPTPNTSAPNTSTPNGHISVRKTDSACRMFWYPLPKLDDSILMFKYDIRHIIDGFPTLPGEFPWMAAIGYESNDRAGKIDYKCGGTIISQKYILTAAHCNSTRNSAKRVRMGIIPLFSKDALELNIETFIKHPKYDSFTKINDIALIRVEGSITFTEFIRPACLRTDISDVSPNVKLIVTGWGSTSALKMQQSTVLLKTNVTAVSLLSCNDTLLKYNRLPDLPALRNGLNLGQMCAFDPKAASDACQGDSGGPLQMFEEKFSRNATVVGVVSFGVSCGTELPGVYTRVAFYIDWIESIVLPYKYNFRSLKKASRIPSSRIAHPFG